MDYKRKFHKATGMLTLLTRSSSLDPIFSVTVSGVNRICPWIHTNSLLTRLSAVPLPTPASSFVQPTLFRVPLPLPDTARFQVQKSFVWFRAKTDKGIVCLAGHPYSATGCHLFLMVFVVSNIFLILSLLLK